MYSVTTPLNKQYALLSKYSIDTRTFSMPAIFFTFLFCKLLTTCINGTIIIIYSPLMDKKSLNLFTWGALLVHCT